MSDYPRDTYDPKTPWLEFDQVVAMVELLPPTALQELARGPLPDLEGAKAVDRCRACRALRPYAETRLRKEIGPYAQQSVDTLLEWHDDLGVSDRFQEIYSRWIPKETADGKDPAAEFAKEYRDLLGKIAHARCSVIYLAALATLRDPDRMITVG